MLVLILNINTLLQSGEITVLLCWYPYIKKPKLPLPCCSITSSDNYVNIKVCSRAENSQVYSEKVILVVPNRLSFQGYLCSLAFKSWQIDLVSDRTFCYPPSLNTWFDHWCNRKFQDISNFNSPLLWWVKVWNGCFKQAPFSFRRQKKLLLVMLRQVASLPSKDCMRISSSGLKHGHLRQVVVLRWSFK